MADELRILLVLSWLIQSKPNDSLDLSSENRQEDAKCAMTVPEHSYMSGSEWERS